METLDDDHGSTDHQETSETAMELKAKIHQNGIQNHIDVSHQNGIDSISNHVDEKPEKSERDSSPSKHASSGSSSKHSSSHSSKSKDHHSSSSSSKPSDGSSSSKHREGSSSSKSHHSSSSSSKHKEGSSSSSSKHKDGSSSSSSKHRESSSHSSSSSHKHKSSSSEHKSSSGEHKSSSSSDKHRDRPKEGSSSKEGDKHKDRHKEGHSSSSSDKHKDRPKDGQSSSSSSDKHRDRPKDSHSSSSSDKHKSSSSSSDKHKERSKEGHSSSSDKHKERSKDGEHKSKSSSSSHSSSDKHKDRPKDGSSSSKSKEGSKESSSKPKESSSSSSDKHREDKHKEIKKEPVSPSKSPSKHESVSPSKSPSKHTIKEEPEPEIPDVKEEPRDEEPMSDDDVPLAIRAQDVTPSVKRAPPESDDDDEPLSARVEKVKKKIKKEEKSHKAAKKRKQEEYSDDEKPVKKKKIKKESDSSSPEKGKKKKKKEGEEDQPEVWRWWEEESRGDGVKWNYLEHKGPIFAPDYEPLPDHVKFYYEGKPMKLSEETEEVATFYGRMLDHDYTTKDVFNKNFFKDWRKVMTPAEKEKITDLKKCKFHEINDYFKLKSEERKNRPKEEKKAEKLKNDEIQKEYGVCVFDGHKEKIGNFRIEPPGLFRGRGEHPKQGMLKKRIQPENVIINCSKNSKCPQAPDGHKWKEVRHDNKVSWLACWTENVQGQTKYVMLNAASRLKGEKDWQKYETARKLHKIVDNIRENYRNDWKSKEMRIRQRAVALYFIDKLALRAGNEKEEGETADTVGCCSLRVEHINLHEKYDDLEYVVEFDFLGKDSIRYYNRIPVEKRAFKNLQLFAQNKAPGDDLFDRLNTAILNKHLSDLMPGLTAKVFRTYNASRTLQEQLNLLTEEEDNPSAKLLSYNRANRAVAILCNHQRAVPKNFDKQMENLQTKIDAKKDTIKDAKKQVKAAKADYKATKATRTKMVLDKKKKMLERLEEQLTKLEVQATDKDENKEIALGTSKLNYLDPRISVAWCKKWEVPIEKIYNKTQRDKFRWAIDMATEEFQF